MASWLVTSRHATAIAAAIGLITLCAILLSSTPAQSEDLLAQPAGTTKISRYHEKVVHVQVDDGSYSTETSRETSSTVFMEE